jgi:hypothetical protein
MTVDLNVEDVVQLEDDIAGGARMGGVDKA